MCVLRLACTLATLLCWRSTSVLAQVTHVKNGHSSWRTLAPLPQALAGQCVGRVGKLLVVAGGSTWTAAPWAGGKKDWSANVYSLASLDGTWRTEQPLLHARGYGASVQGGDSLLCVGGQDGEHAFDSVLRLSEADGTVVAEEMPKLPQPLTNAAAAIVGDTLIVAGGQHGLTPDTMATQMWSLPLNAGVHAEWEAMKPPPWEHQRILPVAVGCGHTFVIMSGAELASGGNGTVIRHYLKDVWRRDARGGWTRMMDLPAPVVAAPSVCGPGGVPIVFGGDDGILAPQANVLRDAHPGFRTEVLKMNPSTGRWGQWRGASPMPVSLVTTAAATWQGHYVIAGGEPKPGHRSSQVIAWAIPNR